MEEQSRQREQCTQRTSTGHELNVFEEMKTSVTGGVASRGENEREVRFRSCVACGPW